MKSKKLKKILKPSKKKKNQVKPDLATGLFFDTLSYCQLTVIFSNKGIKQITLSLEKLGPLGPKLGLFFAGLKLGGKPPSHSSSFKKNLLHQSAHPLAQEFKQWLKSYKKKQALVFPWELLDVEGYSDFQIKVWRALWQIPFGEVRSYQEIAKKIGQPKAYRAVGNANGANPLPLVIPCHRVIAADGSLGGFACGLELKKRLLAHEGVVSS